MPRTARVLIGALVALMISVVVGVSAFVVLASEHRNKVGATPDPDDVITADLAHGWANAGNNGWDFAGHPAHKESSKIYYSDGSLLFDGDRSNEEVFGEQIASWLSEKESLRATEWGDGYHTFGPGIEKPDDIETARKMLYLCKVYAPNLSLDLAKDMYKQYPDELCVKGNTDAPFYREYRKFVDVNNDGKPDKDENWINFINQGCYDLWSDQEYWEAEFAKLWAFIEEKYPTSEIVVLDHGYRSSRYTFPATADHGEVVYLANTDGHVDSGDEWWQDDTAGWAIVLLGKDGSKLYYRGSCFFQGIYWEEVPEAGTEPPKTTEPPEETTGTTRTTEVTEVTSSTEVTTDVTTQTTVVNTKDINDGVNGTKVSTDGHEQFIGTEVEGTDDRITPDFDPGQTPQTETRTAKPEPTEAPTTKSTQPPETQQATTKRTEPTQSPTSPQTEIVTHAPIEATNPDSQPSDYEPATPPSTEKVVTDAYVDDDY